MPQVSILMPARNEDDRIARQLESLAALHTRHAHEVVVADHGSTDRTVAVAKSYRKWIPGLRVIDASRARNVGGVRNCAAAAAQGSFLAFCDADDMVDPGWLDALVAAADNRDVLVRGTVQLEAVIGEREPASGEEVPTSAGFLPFADTCSMGITARAFRAIGGFDDSLRRSSDVDFSWRALYRGVPLVPAPRAIAYKSRPMATRDRAKQSFLWGQAQTALYRRHRDFGMPSRGLHDLYGDLVTIGVAVRRGRAYPGTVVAAGWAAGRLAGSVCERVWYP
jgi:glycosyltransferase involved in cell wall biosynthesis